MTEARRVWRGRRVAPRTPREAWGAFAAEVGVAAMVGIGIAVVLLLVAQDEISLNPRNLWDFFWIRVGALTIGPLVLGYEVWLLWQRLSAFRRGEVFVDDDEHAPDAVPAPSGRKRRETAAQKKRRKTFWRVMILITAVWVFCAGAAAVLVVDDFRKGRPFGEAGMFLIGLVALYVVIVVLSVKEKRDKDRGL
ncbi:hypothetical protein [Tabrizicola sp.]|uniref:hypothetical protein n=1 Tax=Tabrizicola sp. TaxID=2005166 RepID=UPI0027361A03|nr:hypothetical protein [Tabrizicola sp.]MDP3195745.1 hypothetical protein [Tabrizicola sp.]